MALEPLISYGVSDVPDPMAAFQRGQLWRSQQEELQRVNLARQQSEARAAEIQKAVGSLPPNATVDQLNAVIFKYPEIADRFKAQIANLEDKDRERRYNETIPVYAALSNGRADLAETMMRDRATALRNAGDEQGAKNAEVQANLIKADPGTASTSIGLFLSATQDPKKFAETFGQLGAERRAQELQAPTLGIKTAEQILKELDAQYAPKKILADLGLTQAQTSAALASAAASRANAGKINAETAAMGQVAPGLIPLEKRPEAEGKMRDEFDKRTKTFQDVRDAYSRIQASEETAAGDLSLIFNYMKMLDPGSAVREGEFSNAQNAAGIPDRIRNTYNRLINGERLNTDQRKMFTSQATSLFKSAEGNAKVVRDGLTRIATGYGLNPSNIFYENPAAPPPPPPAAPPATRPAAPPPSAASAGGVGSATGGKIRVKF